MVFTFSVDKYLDPYVPPSIVPRLPRFISRWLGGHTPRPIPDYILWIDVFVSSFASIVMLEGIFMNSPVFQRHHAPTVFASYGATAVLTFTTSDTAFAQPRNILFGHIISSLIGVSLQKLFGLSQAGRDHFYLAGGLSVGISSVLMLITNTVHPPSGATALIPIMDDRIRMMGWWYIPVHIICSCLMIVVACITNNILRRYPTHWWTEYTPADRRTGEDDEEKAMDHVSSSTSATSAQKDIECEQAHDVIKTRQLVVGVASLEIPEGFTLQPEEMALLQDIQKRLQI